MTKRSLDPMHFTTIRDKFSVKGKTAVRPGGLQGCQDLFVGFYPHQISGLETEIAPGGEFPNRYPSFPSGERNATRGGLEAIVKPAGRPTPAVFISLRTVIVG
jgi:hypothetical protein